MQINNELVKDTIFPSFPIVCVCMIKNKAAYWCSIWHVFFFFCFIKIHALIACFRWRQTYVDAATSVVVKLFRLCVKTNAANSLDTHREREKDRLFSFLLLFYFANEYIFLASKEKGVRFYFYTRVIYDTTCREITINLFLLNRQI